MVLLVLCLIVNRNPLCTVGLSKGSIRKYLHKSLRYWVKTVHSWRGNIKLDQKCTMYILLLHLLLIQLLLSLKLLPSVPPINSANMTNAIANAKGFSLNVQMETSWENVKREASNRLRWKRSMHCCVGLRWLGAAMSY